MGQAAGKARDRAEPGLAALAAPAGRRNNAKIAKIYTPILSMATVTAVASSSLAMPPVNVLTFPIASPADTSPLNSLLQEGYEHNQILAVIGKTEGEFDH